MKVHFDGEPDYLKRMRRLHDKTAQEDTMTFRQLLAAYLVALGPMAFVVALVAVECKRGLVRAYRGWRVRRMLDECQHAYNQRVQHVRW